MKKKVLGLLLTGILVFSTLLTGCGNIQKSNKGNNTKDEGPWYSVKYHDLQLEKTEYMNVTQLYGENLYYVKAKTNEEGRTMNLSLGKVNIHDFTVSEQPLTLEKDYYVMAMYVNENGIYLATQMSRWNDDYSKLLEASYEIIQCDLDGNVTTTLDLTDALSVNNTGDDMVYMSSMVCDTEGNIYVSDNNSYVEIFSPSGESLKRIETNGTWGNGLTTDASGKVYYMFTDDVTWDMAIAKVDLEKGEIGEAICTISNNGSSTVANINENEQMYITENGKLKLYDMNTEEKTDILTWMDYDILEDSVRIVTQIDEDTLFAYCENYGDGETSYELATLTQSDVPLEDKTILTYAAVSMDSDISRAIIRFNKNSDTYRIKVVEYYDEEDYEAGISAYNEALLNGDGIDLMNVSLENYKTYASKGVYADLNEFMNKDSSINRADYFENVLDAYELDGKLYAMPISFGISTIVGKGSVWNDTKSLTSENVAEMMKKAGSDAEVMDHITKSQWLYVALQGSMDSYINWETGECSFNSDKFISMLELANSFPAESEWVEGEASTPVKIQSGKLLLYGDQYSSIQDYQVTKAIFDNDAVFLGYPDSQGSGTLINNYNVIAMSNGSENKEGAWEFIKYLISEDYQTNYVLWYNPILKSAFDKQMENAMVPSTYVDENGEEVETPSMTYGWGDDFEISIYSATKEDAEQYKALAESADTLVSYEEDVYTIINEEVESFFAGDKSAKDVADVIQSRVNIFINESR